MNPDHRRQIEIYLALAREFALERGDGASFRRQFMHAFKQDQRRYDPRVGDLLMELFNDAECHQPDPKLLKELQRRDASLYIDEPTLRLRAKSFIEGAEALLRADPA